MNFIEAASGLWLYWLIIVLMMIGLYIVTARDHLIKKVMGLNILQGAAILFFIAMAKVEGGTAPIVSAEAARNGSQVLYSSPLPHVLMLTAIVVGVATTALALALAVRIHAEYGTAEEDEVVAYDARHG